MPWWKGAGLLSSENLDTVLDLLREAMTMQETGQCSLCNPNPGGCYRRSSGNAQHTLSSANGPATSLSNQVAYHADDDSSYDGVTVMSADRRLMVQLLSQASLLTPAPEVTGGDCDAGGDCDEE